jgi:hypothetical protein
MNDAKYIGLDVHQVVISVRLFASGGISHKVIVIPLF